MDSGTVSSFNVILKINGSGNIQCQLKRHLSPITVGLIMRMLPLSGRAHQMGKPIVYFETNLNSGIERKKIDFKSGDVAFLPIEGCVCFFINDMHGVKPMTPIGKIIEIEKLNLIKPGDVLSLSRN